MHPDDQKAADAKDAAAAAAAAVAALGSGVVETSSAGRTRSKTGRLRLKGAFTPSPSAGRGHVRPKNSSAPSSSAEKVDPKGGRRIAFKDDDAINGLQNRYYIVSHALTHAFLYVSWDRG